MTSKSYLGVHTTAIVHDSSEFELELDEDKHLRIGFDQGLGGGNVLQIVFDNDEVREDFFTKMTDLIVSLEEPKVVVD